MPSEPCGDEQSHNEGRPPKKWQAIVHPFSALKGAIDRRKIRAKKQKTEHQVNEMIMARWTRHVGIFTFALVGVSIVTAVIFWEQLSVMQG